MTGSDVTVQRTNSYSQSAFARVYSRHFGGFVQAIRDPLVTFAERRRNPDESPRLLDLACGGGHLLRHFVGHGYRGVGLDQSKAMLDEARRLLSDVIGDGRVRLVQADVTDFALDERFPLVTATFGAVNHLVDEKSLSGCFRSVLEVTEPGGVFVFDLQTVTGFADANNVQVRDGADEFFVARVLKDPLSNRSVARVSGFVRQDDQWERFENVVTEAAWPIGRVLELLEAAGWSQAHAASLPALDTPVNGDPDKLDRAFLVAVR